MWRLVLFILACILAAPVQAASSNPAIPRTVIALYDGRASAIGASYIHTVAEMPLNHLGLKLEYYDIYGPLPDIAKRDDVRGVLTWFLPGTQVPDPEAYLKWGIGVLRAGKKFVIMGPTALEENSKHPIPKALRENFLHQIGFSMQPSWLEFPFTATYRVLSPDMLLALNPYEWIRPGYEKVQANVDLQVHLQVQEEGHPEHDSDLIITGPSGGYIATHYIIRSDDQNDEEIHQWLINPFEFFRLAFATDDLPKPDVTTLAGRRIYYSHIDGDGWNNVTQLEEYRDKPVLSAQVIMERAVKAYPDLPVTLTLIGGDIDPKWAGIEQSRPIAKEFFTLPQVEAGTHTYSHPFYWQLFDSGRWQNEIPYLKRYHHQTWTPSPGVKPETPTRTIPAGYEVPRAYAYEPFNLEKEIDGSVKAISALLPKGKKVEIITWSGNCSPWENAVHAAHQSGLRNINGGDSRFDAQYPAYASVAPIGKPVGKQRQIYASASNENTYTNLWTNNFFGHRYLMDTFKNTESPMRLKPLNIYYHIYTGERDAGLNTLLANLDYVRSQEIAPVTASHYTRVAEGFYDTQFIPVGPDSWRIEKRGALQTIRFDQGTFLAVDFQRSQGVIGQRHLQGSLYVYLDAAVAQPVITLKLNPRHFATPPEEAPYLVQSRWLISGLKRQDKRLEFSAQGFGPGEMVWQVPPGRYRVSIGGKEEQLIDTDGNLLRFELQRPALQPVQVTITPMTKASRA